MKISVAMATYNGEKFIRKQLESILGQIGDEDEVIVSDDGSEDRTLDIVSEFKDKRIKVFDGPHRGVKQNFGNAIDNCSGDYVFLADQDDIWLPNKIAIVLEAFRKNRCACVVHDAEVFDSKTGKIIERSFFGWRKSGKGILKNIWKNTYIGCCMAFDAKIKKDILPIPNNINMHDQWVGIICERHGGCIFIPEILIKYRRHNKNQTDMKRGNLLNMIRMRLILIANLLRRVK